MRKKKLSNDYIIAKWKFYGKQAAFFILYIFNTPFCIYMTEAGLNKEKIKH
jgi:hypothetical protein